MFGITDKLFEKEVKTYIVFVQWEDYTFNWQSKRRVVHAPADMDMVEVENIAKDRMNISGSRQIDYRIREIDPITIEKDDGIV